MRVSILFFIFLVISFSNLKAQDKNITFQNKKALMVPQIKFEPNIDGKLSDEGWNLGKSIILTHMDGAEGSPYDKTLIKIVASKTNIFISFYCQVPNSNELIVKAQNQDEDMSKDDRVTFLISPGIEANTKIFQISVNSKGIIADSVNNDKTWNWEGAVVAVSKGDGFWSVEMSLPLKEFESHLKKLKYKGWRANFFRILPEKGWEDLTEASWTANIGGNSYDIEQAGYIFIESIGDKIPENVISLPVGETQDVLYLNLISVQVPKINKDEILIDGDIREQINAGAIPIFFKKLDNTPDPATGKVIPFKNKTEGWLCTVKNTLVVSIRCYESSMNKIISSEKIRDSGNAWADDSIELFISIGKEESNSYYHIAVNAHGSIYDSFEKNVAWNGNNIKAGTLRKEDFWDLEIQIPFEDLDMTKVQASMGQPWRINIVRHRPIHQAPEEVEEAAWSPTGSTKSHEPSKFGFIFMDIMNAKLK